MDDEERQKLFRNTEQSVLAFYAAAVDTEGDEAKHFQFCARALHFRLDQLVQQLGRATVQMPCMSCGQVVRIIPFYDWADCGHCGTTHSR
jgi:hypothetical protein